MGDTLILYRTLRRGGENGAWLRGFHVEAGLRHPARAIVGTKGHAGAMLRVVLAAAGVGHVVQIEDSRKALSLLSSEHFDAVFVEETHLDGLNFARSARKRAALRNPLIPIFAVYSGPRRRDVEKARDLGVTSVIPADKSQDSVRQAARGPDQAQAVHRRAGFFRARPPRSGARLART